MGGMVYDGRTLCRVHTGHRPFFEILPCDLDLGNGERGKREKIQLQMTKSKVKWKSEIFGENIEKLSLRGGLHL